MVTQLKALPPSGEGSRPYRAEESNCFSQDKNCAGLDAILSIQPSILPLKAGML